MPMPSRNPFMALRVLDWDRARPSPSQWGQIPSVMFNCFIEVNEYDKFTTNATMKPVRVQLSRKKGFKLPPNTVVVSRPSKWGNPYRIGHVHNGVMITDAQMAVEYHRSLVDKGLMRIRIKIELGGKNLACWCKLGDWCHGDTLLEIANK